jgi:hypothetical protein
MLNGTQSSGEAAFAVVADPIHSQEIANVSPDATDVCTSNQPSYVIDDYPAALKSVNFSPNTCVGDWFHGNGSGGFCARNCTSYVGWRVNRDLMAPTLPTSSAPGWFGNYIDGVHLGNACHWAGTAEGSYCSLRPPTAAQQLNWETSNVDETPRVGSIAQFTDTSAMPQGHVAYVEQVFLNSDNSVNYICVSDYNWADTGNFLYHAITRSSPNLPRFIHVTDPGGDNIKITASPATQTVQLGSTAQFTATVTGLNGYHAPVQMFGYHFPPGYASAAWSKYEISPDPGSNTSALTIQTNDLTTTGTFPIILRASNNEPPGASADVTVTLQVVSGSGSQPTISNMSPSSIPASTGETQFTLNGTGFSSSSTLNFVSYPVGYNPVSVSGQPIESGTTTQITAEGQFGMTPAPWTVAVVTNGTPSAPYSFTVVPTITGMSPDPVPPSSGKQQLTINGTGFTSGSTLNFVAYPASGGSNPYPGQPIISATPTQIIASASLGTTPATWTVQVVTNGITSNVFTFSVGSQ